ncbi:hypothetical protein ACHAXH_002845 [Discostella pseudostelligera]
MENMSLASRCRESISALASLRSELVVCKKREAGLVDEVSALRREVAVLRYQQQQQNQQNPHGTTTTSGNSRGGSNNNSRGSMGMHPSRSNIDKSIVDNNNNNNNNNNNMDVMTTNNDGPSKLASTTTMRTMTNKTTTMTNNKSNTAVDGSAAASSASSWNNNNNKDRPPPQSDENICIDDGNAPLPSTSVGGLGENSSTSVTTNMAPSNNNTLNNDADRDAGGRVGGGNPRAESPTTDLDRIMSSQQFRKPDNRSLLRPAGGGGGGGNASGSVSLSLSKRSEGGGAGAASGGGALTSVSKQQPLQPHSTRKMDNHLLTSSNTKIPISVSSSKKVSATSSSSSAFSTATTTTASSSSSSVQQPKDEDEFDADIDMVDFFAQSQNSLLNKSIVGNSLSSSNHHLGSRAHHVRKTKSTATTDDRMPGDVISTLPTTSSSGVGTSGGGGGASGGSGIAKKSSSTSSNSSSTSSSSLGLLSSLDAFEASFASAFPETSFSITSDLAGPLSSASLDMSFDVPDFDPFFKGPSIAVAAAVSSTNNKGDATTTTTTIMGGVLGARGSGGGGSNGVGGSRGEGTSGVVVRNSNSESMKNQTLQDLFPESAMSFKTSPKLDILAFDSNPSMTTPFEPMERMMTHHTSAVPIKQQRGGSSIGVVGNSQLSPQSITAEIEQLDAIANLASSSTSSMIGVSSSASKSSNSIQSRTTLRSSGRKG